MKTKIIYITILMCCLSFTSCESYLTHYLGDQMTVEEVFDKRETTERYLAQVYSFLPNDKNVLDNMVPCSDEAYFSWTAWVNYISQNDGSYYHHLHYQYFLRYLNSSQDIYLIQ